MAKKKSPIKAAQNHLSGAGLAGRVNKGVAAALGTGTKPKAKPRPKVKPKLASAKPSKTMQTAAAKGAANRRAATKADNAKVAAMLAKKKRR